MFSWVKLSSNDFTRKQHIDTVQLSPTPHRRRRSALSAASVHHFAHTVAARFSAVSFALLKHHQMLTGAGGGVAGIIAGQPLDVVRVRLQQKSPHTGSLASMWKHIVKMEGGRSLFKGAAYPVTTIAMQVRLQEMTMRPVCACDCHCFT